MKPKDVHRVLVVQPCRALGRRLADHFRRKGHEVVLADSVEAARAAPGRFDQGIFALDLTDGSGIVLAASMKFKDRLHKVTFVHPDWNEADLESGIYSRPPLDSSQVA